MSENIRPSEVSEVLLRQLKDIDTSLQFDEVGTVLQVSDGVVRIYGFFHAEATACSMPRRMSCWSLRMASKPL